MMKNQNKFSMRHLASPFGYVATAAPGWSADCNDLARAIAPNARMSMRQIDYCTAASWRDHVRYMAIRDDAWFKTIEYADVILHSIDESVTLPDYGSVREAVKNLIRYTIAGNWYVAGFVVCEEVGLYLLLGYIHDHAKIEEPCRLYATVNVVYPVKELHLRFQVSNSRMQKAGEPLFREVHMTAPPEDRSSHDYDAIRVREFSQLKPHGVGMYDVEDLDFTRFGVSDVPVARFSGVKAWPVIHAT